MIGRRAELDIFTRLLNSPKAELLFLTGRRRVGKTYLVRQGFKENICFEFVGTQNAELKNQLEKFATVLSITFPNHGTDAVFNNWSTAFDRLNLCLTSMRKSRKKRVVFFDEFPWIAHHKSNFLQEFEYWWNAKASKQNVVVVISGSATSWMIKKITNNKEGLYDRVTSRIHLQPFTLYETDVFLKSKKINYTPYQVIQIYMAMGGIPQYLESLTPGLSVSQNISVQCFSTNGALRVEFQNLYKALFESYENYVIVIRALAGKWKGLTRQEIARYSKLTDGGGLSKILTDLEQCSFIIKMVSIGKKTKDVLYRLIDEYSLFYLHFIEGSRVSSTDIWLHKIKTQEVISWQGYAFENVCLRHYEAIKIALGISGIYTEISSFYKKGNTSDKGAQIDLIIDRADQSINLCEMKFYNDRFTLNKKDAVTLRQRRSVFIDSTNTKKAVFNTLITTYGIYKNEASFDQVDQEMSADKLFNLKRFD